MEKETLIIISLFVLSILVIVLILLFGNIYLIPYVTESPPEHVFDCSEYEGELSTQYNLKEEWLLSENITGYKDIPDNHKTNLSNETIEVLKLLGEGSFNSSNYSELTEEQKRNFKKGLKSGRVLVDDRNAPPPSHVFYKSQMYTCDTDRYLPE